LGRECSTQGEKRNVCRILVGKPEGERPVGIPRCGRWVCYTRIKVNLRETGWDGMDWFDLAQVGTSGRLL
jgi:hypothetical protein